MRRKVGTLTAGSGEVRRVASVYGRPDPVGVEGEVGRQEQLGVGVEAAWWLLLLLRLLPPSTPLVEAVAVPPIVSELPKRRIGPSGLGITPSFWSTGVDVAFWSYGNEITPVTEMTSLSTAGSDMPLTSPKRRIVGIVIAHAESCSRLRQWSSWWWSRTGSERAPNWPRRRSERSLP